MSKAIDSMTHYWRPARLMFTRLRGFYKKMWFQIQNPEERTQRGSINIFSSNWRIVTIINFREQLIGENSDLPGTCKTRNSECGSCNLHLIRELVASGFLPHGAGYLWDSRIIWLHVISDGLISLSYYFIPIPLIYVASKRRDIPFKWMFWMFGLFILSCGTVHLLEIWTIWHSNYFVTGIAKAFTAAISLATAIMLVPLVPQALARPNPEQLRAVNRELGKEIAKRERREQQLETLTHQLEVRVKERTRELETLNKSLEKELAAGVQAHLALRTSQTRLSSVIESAMDAIVMVDDEHRILLFNGAAEKVFGVKMAEAAGQPLNRFIPHRFRGAHDQHIRRFSATGVTGRKMGALGELSALRADGTEFPVEASISQTEADGKKVFTVILRDITERRQAEARNLLLAAIVESSDDAIISKNLSGTILSWNKGAERLYGYTEAQAVGKHISLIVPPDRQDEITGLLSKIAVGRAITNEETTRLRQDGSTIDISLIISPMKDADEHVIGASVIARDVTDRKLAESELRERNQILELAPILVTDLDGRVVLWNRGSEEFYGYPKEDAISRVAHDLLHTEYSQPLGQILECLNHFGNWDGELVHQRRDGTRVVVNSHWVLHCDAQGRPTRIVRTNNDITARKAAEQQLAAQATELEAQAQELARSEREIRILNQELEQRVRERTRELEIANNELEAFTYSVSHDLRAPLRHISGFARIISEEHGAGLQPEAGNYLRRIQDGTRRMGLLIDDLLTLGRIGRHALRLQLTGMNSIVRDVINDLKPDTEGRAIEWKIGNLPFVEADPSLLKVVFQNLISNALKYTRPREQALIEIDREQIEGHAAVFVRDNGVGFNMKYADKLFGVFQRLHRAEDFEGTGVGLATVQRIVQKHGGRIWAYAEIDKGATFYFTLGGNADMERDQPETALTGETL
jgi:PAS domain S-box-containing protein